MNLGGPGLINTRFSKSVENAVRRKKSTPGSKLYGKSPVTPHFLKSVLPSNSHIALPQSAAEKWPL